MRHRQMPPLSLTSRLRKGFGIPFLEAAFLGRKVIALDIAMNHEIIARAGWESSRNVYRQPVEGNLDMDAFTRFIDIPADPEFTRRLRESFTNHWQEAGEVLTAASNAAIDAYATWMENVEFKIFSSVPGSSCGVADYSVAYARSSEKNVVFFYSEANEQNITHLPNVRAATYLDYTRFLP